MNDEKRKIKKYYKLRLIQWQNKLSYRELYNTLSQKRK